MTDFNDQNGTDGNEGEGAGSISDWRVVGGAAAPSPNQQMFRGRAFSIPYDTKADEHAAMMARARTVTRTQTPGMVVQVGDMVIPVGTPGGNALDSATAAKVSDLVPRSYAQLVPQVQEFVTKNIAWQYGTGSNGADAVGTDPTMKKSFGAALAKLVGADHLVAPAKKRASGAPRPTMAPAVPSPAAVDPVRNMVPKRTRATAGDQSEPARLIPKAGTPGDTVKRLLNNAPKRPKSLFDDVKQGVAVASPAPTMASSLTAMAANHVVPTAHLSNSAPDALATARPVPAPAARPADVSTEPAPRVAITPDTYEAPGEVLSENDVESEAPYTGEDRRDRVKQFSLFHQTHAFHRQGFQMESMWTGAHEGEGSFISKATHEPTGTTEIHHIVPEADGTLSHTHRIMAPGPEDDGRKLVRTKKTSGYASYAALHAHATKQYFSPEPSDTPE